MKKTFKVVMLPTNQKVNFACGLQPNGVLKYCSSLSDLGIGKPQHLYIISDEEIKECDWFIGETGIVKRANKIGKNNAQIHTSDGYAYFKHKSKKIIATTDKSLGITDYRVSPVPNFCDMPRLHESFIQAFVKAYNEGKPITEVDLEVNESTKYNIDELRERHLNGLPHTYNKPLIKTRPDNTVIIHRSKKYTEQELIEILTEFGCYLGKKKTDSESYLRTYKDVMRSAVIDWGKETGKI